MAHDSECLLTKVVVVNDVITDGTISNMRKLTTRKWFSPIRSRAEDVGPRWLSLYMKYSQLPIKLQKQVTLLVDDS